MKLKVVTRTGQPVAEVWVDATTGTVAQLQLAIQRASRQRWSPARQALSLDVSSSSTTGAASKSSSTGSSSSKVDAKTGKPLRLDVDPEARLAGFPLVDGDTIVFKDLGPQVGWTTVFLVEYAGPLWIHPLLFFRPQWFYFGTVYEEEVVG